MLYTIALRKRREAELEVAGTKMLWFSLGATTVTRIRNDYNRGSEYSQMF